MLTLEATKFGRRQKINATGISRLILTNLNGSTWITGKDETKVTTKTTCTEFAGAKEAAWLKAMK